MACCYPIHRKLVYISSSYSYSIELVVFFVVAPGTAWHGCGVLLSELFVKKAVEGVLLHALCLLRLQGRRDLRAVQQPAWAILVSRVSRLDLILRQFVLLCPLRHLVRQIEPVCPVK